MKLFTLLLFILPFTISAQITLNNTDFSDEGDLLFISTATDANIDYSTTGINQTWDFSGLVSTGQAVKEYFSLSGASFLVGFTFGTFAGVDYQATNYTTSNDLPIDQLSQFLPVEITDVRQFSKNSVDSITSVGLSMTVSGTEIPFKSDTIETRYNLPLNFGDVYDSRGYSNIDMNPVYNGMWRQYRQRHSEVDGWGSITTPYGTFDALRVHHTINETDSLFIDLFGTGTWIELPIPVAHQYEWIATGEKEPILRVSTSEIGGNETVTSIEYKDNDLSANLTELSSKFQIFPNPTSDFIIVEGIEQGTSYSVYNHSGKKIQIGDLDLNNNRIDVTSLIAGQYFIELTIDEKSTTHSFVKQ